MLLPRIPNPVNLVLVLVLDSYALLEFRFQLKQLLFDQG